MAAETSTTPFSAEPRNVQEEITVESRDVRVRDQLPLFTSQVELVGYAHWSHRDVPIKMIASHARAGEVHLDLRPNRNQTLFPGAFEIFIQGTNLRIGSVKALDLPRLEAPGHIPGSRKFIGMRMNFRDLFTAQQNHWDNRKFEDIHRRVPAYVTGKMIFKRRIVVALSHAQVSNVEAAQPPNPQSCTQTVPGNDPAAEGGTALIGGG